MLSYSFPPVSLDLFWCLSFSTVFLLTVSLSLRFLELKMQEMEARHRQELEVLREEKSNLQALVVRQSGVILELETQLGKASGNSTVLQKQQQDLMNTVHSLLNLCSKDGGTEIPHRSALSYWFPKMLWWNVTMHRNIVHSEFGLCFSSGLEFGIRVM